MPEGSGGIGPAVQEALDWLGATPESAGALLRINGRTLVAMCQGIVPMRSLVIRFATELARHCDLKPGAPEWWRDVDEWLRIAGYEARRDGGEATGSHRGPGPDRPPRQERPAGEQPRPNRPSFRPPAPSAPGGVSTAAMVDAPAESVAAEAYRPVYERRAFNDRMIHVFHILDSENQRAFEMSFPMDADYKARAAQIKRDLANLTQPQFDRKYGRYRVTS